jgi:hypothetical protein
MLPRTRPRPTLPPFPQLSFAPRGRATRLRTRVRRRRLQQGQGFRLLPRKLVETVQGSANQRHTITTGYDRTNSDHPMPRYISADSMVGNDAWPNCWGCEARVLSFFNCLRTGSRSRRRCRTRRCGGRCMPQVESRPVKVLPLHLLDMDQKD